MKMMTVCISEYFIFINHWILNAEKSIYVPIQNLLAFTKISVI